MSTHAPTLADVIALEAAAHDVAQCVRAILQRDQGVTLKDMDDLADLLHIQHRAFDNIHFRFMKAYDAWRITPEALRGDRPPALEIGERQG